MADNNEEEYLNSLLDTYMNKDSEPDAEDSSEPAEPQMDKGKDNAGKESYEDYTSKSTTADDDSRADVSDLMTNLMDIVNNKDDSKEDNESDDEAYDLETLLNQSFNDNKEDKKSDNSDSRSDEQSDDTDHSQHKDTDMNDDSDIFALEENMEENMSEPDKADSTSVNDSSDLEESAKEQNNEDLSPKGKKDKKAKKDKKKFNIKDIFKKKTKDNTIDPEETNADDNAEIINELYENTESLDDIPVEDGSSKGKKKKDKKEKKPKKDKEKKAKKPKKAKPVVEKNPSDYMTIKTGTIVRTVLFVAIVVAAVIFGSRFTYYKICMHDSRTYYNNGQYDLAYDKIAGLDIKSDDENYYYKLRTIMTVYNKYLGYNSYMELGRTADAVDSLIQGVGKYNECKKNAETYVVTEQVKAIYQNILRELEKYKITEDMAVKYSEMTDYSQYSKILQKYGGSVKSDSNN